MSIMKDIVSRIDRKDILNNIGRNLKRKFTGKIISATAYGSALCDDFCHRSDFDILLIFKNLEKKDIKKLREIKQAFLKRKIIIDFNVHLESELPKTRGGAYWHNNRALFIQKELEIYGMQLIGKNLFINPLFDKQDMRLEAVRMINSLVYQSRKILINENRNSESRFRIVKFCIYATLYSLAFLDKYPNTKKVAFNLFRKNYITKIDPEYFLKIKITKSHNISDEDIEKAVNFLSEIDRKIYKLHKKNGTKNIV